MRNAGKNNSATNKPAQETTQQRSPVGKAISPKQQNSIISTTTTTATTTKTTIDSSPTKQHDESLKLASPQNCVQSQEAPHLKLRMRMVNASSGVGKIRHLDKMQHQKRYSDSGLLVPFEKNRGLQTSGSAHHTTTTVTGRDSSAEAAPIRVRHARSGSLQQQASATSHSSVVGNTAHTRHGQLNISTGGTLLFHKTAIHQMPKTPQPVLKKRNLESDGSTKEKDEHNTQHTGVDDSARNKDALETPESSNEEPTRVERALFLSESESDADSDVAKEGSSGSTLKFLSKHEEKGKKEHTSQRRNTIAPGTNVAASSIISRNTSNSKKRHFLDAGSPPAPAAMPGNTNRVLRQNYQQKLLSNHRRQSIIQRTGAHKRSQSDFTAEKWDSTLSTLGNPTTAKLGGAGIPGKLPHNLMPSKREDKSNAGTIPDDVQKLKQIRKHHLIVISDDPTEDGYEAGEKERHMEHDLIVSPPSAEGSKGQPITRNRSSASAHRRQGSSNSASSTTSVATNYSTSNSDRQAPYDKKHSASNNNLRIASGNMNVSTKDTMKLLSSSSHVRTSNSSHNSPELYANSLYRWSDLTSDERDKQSSSFSPPGARVDLRDYRRDMYLEQMPQKYLIDVSVFETSREHPSDDKQSESADNTSSACSEQQQQYIDKSSSEHDRTESTFGTSSPPKTVGIKRKSLELVRNEFEEFKRRQKEKLRQKRSQIKFMEVFVFVPHQKNSGVHRVKIKLEHSSKTNGNVLIEAALQQYRIETGQEPIYTQPDGYMLKAAMNDGSVDSDWPAISKKTAIAALGCKYFVLVVDKNFNRFHRRSLSDISEFEPTQTNPSCQARRTLLKVDSETGALSVSSLPKCLADIRFKVLMSDSDSMHTSLYTVPIAPDVLIKDILAVIESRLNLEKGVYDIQLMKDNGMRTSIPPHLRYRTARFLEVETVALLRKYKKVTPSRKTASMSETFEFAIPNTSIDYTEYRVIKINKYGMRQERILGIDSQFLYNKLPKAKNKTKKFLENTVNMLQRHRRQVERPLSTLQKTTRSTKNPLAFTTLFQNVETLYWEAKTKIEAEEIVNTLNYLQRVHQASSFFKNPLSVTPAEMSLA
uniref:SIN1-type PH domain-containing protein n=1 Tax=Percolomonas cosmopolitus TaxID=63605 RepID=A0A7S1KN24_9EUKA|mmetsp:Transcript_1785/g.6318  ORF Transcript_1785/g.6318 Transcript_1785/m.6318 type:complete len:1099 (+) Transcript_1785:277-3573(+)